MKMKKWRLFKNSKNSNKEFENLKLNKANFYKHFKVPILLKNYPILWMLLKDHIVCKK